METEATDPSWDVITIGDYRSPPTAKVKCEPGIVMAEQGYIPGPIEIEIILSNDDERLAFEKAREAWSWRRIHGQAIKVAHHGLAMWSIDSIVLASIAVRVSPGPVTATLKGFEFRVPQ